MSRKGIFASLYRLKSASPKTEPGLLTKAGIVVGAAETAGHVAGALNSLKDGEELVKGVAEKYNPCSSTELIEQLKGMRGQVSKMNQDLDKMEANLQLLLNDEEEKAGNGN